MKLKSAIELTVESINEYEYKNNETYLYPLNIYVAHLFGLLNYTSENEKFNFYISESLLPGYQTYVNYTLDKKRVKQFELDATAVKEGSKLWSELFKEACKIHSVNALDKEGFDTVNSI